MEEQNRPHTSPIAGEPARIVHIGYALDLVSMLIDMMNNPEEYYLDSEAVAVDDLCNLQHHLVNAKHGVPVSVDASEGLTSEDGDFIMAQDAEGEMRAEAEAERRADAAAELAAELASCDWDDWNY